MILSSFTVRILGFYLTTTAQWEEVGISYNIFSSESAHKQMDRCLEAVTKGNEIA